MTTKLPLAAAALAAALGCALALALGPAVPAGAARDVAAQDGPAVLTVEAAHPADGGVHFIVRLTEGGDAVSDATVRATPTTGAGDQLAPVTLDPADDGQYQGFVSFPNAGTWTVRIASDDPEVAVEQTVDVAVAPSTSGPPTGSNDGGFTPAEDGTGRSAESDSGGGPPIALITALVVLLLGGAAFAAVAIRRSRRAHPTPAPPVPRAKTTKKATTGETAATGAAGEAGKVDAT